MNHQLLRYILYYQISVSPARVRKIYISQSWIFYSQNRPLPANSLNLSKTISKEVNIKTRSAAITYFSPSPRSFYFPFPCSFQGGFSGSFCLRLLVFFWVKRLKFSFGTFSNIQQYNAFAFTITYTLIFVKVSTSSNIQVSPFISFLFSSF